MALVPEPPEGLLQDVMHCIKEYERKRAARRTVFFSVLMALSFASLVPAYRLFLSDLQRSGIAQFLSLLFSDFGVVMSSWRMFAMAVLESFPALSVAVVFLLLAVLLQSFLLFKKNVSIVLKPA